jgi:hypothetical protein
MPLRQVIIGHPLRHPSSPRGQVQCYNVLKQTAFVHREHSFRCCSHATSLPALETAHGFHAMLSWQSRGWPESQGLAPKLKSLSLIRFDVQACLNCAARWYIHATLHQKLSICPQETPQWTQDRYSVLLYLLSESRQCRGRTRTQCWSWRRHIHIGTFQA